MLAIAETIIESPNLQRNTASVVKNDGKNENENESVKPFGKYSDLQFADKEGKIMTVNLILDADLAAEVVDNSADESDSSMIDENPDFQLPRAEEGAVTVNLSFHEDPYLGVEDDRVDKNNSSIIIDKNLKISD